MFNKKPPAPRSALFTNPPKKATNWLSDASPAAPAAPAASPAAPHSARAQPAPRDNRAAQSAPHTARAPQTVAPAQSPERIAAPHPAPLSRLTVAAPTPSHAPATTDNGFAALGLRDELIRAVLAHGYDTPTPIQKQAIPIVLKGGDLLGGAQTGTGKTAGFVLPMLQRLMQGVTAQRVSKAPRALILAPTRELAAQVEESVRIYGKFLPLTSTCIFGGVGIQPQVAALRKGVDVVVATPGRLLDHHQQRTIDLSRVEILVLDEADRMLDMGFIHDIKKVLAVLPPKRQNLLFSATFSDEIKALTDRLLNNPQMVEVARRNTTIEVVEQSVVQVEKAHKAKLLIHLVKSRNWQQTLVFTRTKHGANRLAEQLDKSGITAMAIHGNKSQSARTKALAEFKAGSLQVLVATDIAARGIDIDQLPQVVNYELPNVPEDYVHRIGRTGRAGSTGEAMSLVMQEELPLLKDIEKFSKQSIPRVKIEGFNPALIPDPVSTTADARDQEWAARGGRPAPRGRPGGGGGGGGQGRGAPKPAGGGAAGGAAARPRPAAGRPAPRSSGSGGRGR
ncbi:MAG: DEAD/DEAH box helicase [Betaproteobacteria bacterium]|nr:MAG: DEAD/DEAH box helicase [Betaproteobacteria bacterium]